MVTRGVSTRGRHDTDLLAVSRRESGHLGVTWGETRTGETPQRLATSGHQSRDLRVFKDESGRGGLG